MNKWIIVSLFFFLLSHTPLSADRKGNRGDNRGHKGSGSSITIGPHGIKITSPRKGHQERGREMKRHQRKHDPRYYPSRPRDMVIIIPPSRYQTHPRQFINIYRVKSVFVTVNQCSIEEAIDSAGYNWFDPRINSNNFRVRTTDFGTKEIILFGLEADRMRSEEIISDMRSLGYRPATLMELVALDIESDSPIVSLKDDMIDLFPYTKKNGSGYYLRLCRQDVEWERYYLFAAVAVRN